MRVRIQRERPVPASKDGDVGKVVFLDPDVAIAGIDGYRINDWTSVGAKDSRARFVLCGIVPIWAVDQDAALAWERELPPRAPQPVEVDVVTCCRGGEDHCSKGTAAPSSKRTTPARRFNKCQLSAVKGIVTSQWPYRNLDRAGE
jgi:hypothetical protein